MKYAVFVLLAVTAVLSTAVARLDDTPMTPPPIPGFDYSGDMNMSYVLTVEDVQLTFMAALGLWFPYPAGDCNGDGSINAADAGSIFQALMDIVSCYAPIPTPAIPLTPTPTPATGPERVWLSGNTHIGCPGDTVMISVSMENPQTDIDCFGLEFHYDSQTMFYTGFEPGDLDPGWIMIDCIELDPGRVRACGFCIGTPIPSGSSGELLDLTFQSICTDCYWLELYPYAFDWLVDDIQSFYPESGTMDVQCVRPVHNGDTNLDHQLSCGDAQLVFLHVLGLVELNFQQFTTGDCNLDYALTAEDAQLIFQSVMGQAACADPI
ncbi:hypothetical protein JXA80_13255 [bacterium]|nr:hypothetical protein [candidate division CSSED10-310 bacterium]